MKKRKICLLFAAALSLGGCGAKEEKVFSMTEAQQEKYTESIDQVIDEFYWDYDGDSLSFQGGAVPEKTEENLALFTASAACSYPLEGKAGSDAVIGTAKLLHYNGDEAGQLICYFTDHNLSGVCYRGGYDDGYYSLYERNPYLIDGAFARFEDRQQTNRVFQQTSASFSGEGFISTGHDADGNVLVAALQNGSVYVYRYRKGGLQLWKTLHFGQGLEATSACFFKTGEGQEELSVLLSSITESGSGEGEHSYTRSEKIVFYDSMMQQTGEEITLESANAGALASDEGTLLLSVDEVLQEYKRTENGWEKQNLARLQHGVSYMHITDLDGDGIYEYLMSDGMDLYMYHRSGDRFHCIWSTHLGVESLYGVITSGDLNGDGVKEIYVCDMTGTTIRYTLTEKGLRSANEDIAYGQCLYPCDFNEDGQDDYWLVTDSAEGSGFLCMAKKRDAK